MEQTTKKREKIKEKCEETKKHCHCEDCECENENETCKCEDCECDDCHCDECECEECECEECECEEKDKQLQEYTEMLQRLQAEFDNYRKRNEFIVLKAKEEGVIFAVEQILPVLDSFKSAEAHLKESELKGIVLLKEQLLDSLKKLGVVKIEALNKEFDPNLHNAVMLSDEEKEVQTVVEVFQDGYMLKDKVIRHSIVKTTK